MKVEMDISVLQGLTTYEHVDDLLAHGLVTPVIDARLLFLDVDGVLNNEMWRNPVELLSESDGADFFIGSFDPSCVGRLTNVLDEVPDTKIVVSSTWRTDPLLMRCLESVLGEHSRKIIGSTPKYNHGYRGLEIEDFLYSYFRDRTITMCILDDDGDFFGHQKQFHVQTDPEYGVTRNIAYRTKYKLLNSKRTIA